jgi:hypothetical protein
MCITYNTVNGRWKNMQIFIRLFICLDKYWYLVKLRFVEKKLNCQAHDRNCQ